MSILGSKTNLSIDFSANEIRVVEGKYSKKGITVNKSVSIPIPSIVYDDGMIKDMDQLAYLLRNGLSVNKISSGETFGVINSTRIITREITLPMVEDNQIDAIIKYQLEDYLPVNPEDYVVNYLKIGSIMEDGVEKQGVMLIGVPKPVAEGHLNLMKNAGLRPAALDYWGNAVRKLLMTGDRVNGTNDNKGIIATVDLGYKTSAITITQGENIKVSRNGDITSDNLIDSIGKLYPELSEEDIIGRIGEIKSLNESYSSSNQKHHISESIKTYVADTATRIEMILRYYRTREAGNDIDLILLTGEMADIEGVDKLLSGYFDKTVIRLNSMEKVKYEGKLHKYANAIGGLIRLDEVRR